MKLNLLPTTEKKSRQGKTAIVLAGLIVLLALGAAGALTLIPATKLNAAKDGIPELEKRVADADATSKQADTIIASAAAVIRNAQLAQAMIDHNDVYPKLYDDVKRYIPPYFRIQSMTAKAISPTQSELELVGTLSGYQRYADLMLALMRFKDVTSISRSGYNLNDPIVPPLEVDDQFGKMRLASRGPIPDDGLQRLAYFQQIGASAPTGYQAVGNYGSEANDVRGALPDASLIRITLGLTRNLEVPLASDTLRSSGGGAAPALGAGGGGFGPPSGFGGPPGASGPPGPGGPPGRAGRGGGD